MIHYRSIPSNTMLEWNRDWCPIFLWDEVLGGGIFPILSFSICKGSLVFCLLSITNSSSVNITSTWHYLCGVGFFPFPPLHLRGEYRPMPKKWMLCSEAHIWRISHLEDAKLISLTIAHFSVLDFRLSHVTLRMFPHS